MSVHAMGVTIDCFDPERLADFWSEAAGFTNREGNGEPYVTISGFSVERAVNHLTFQRSLKVEQRSTVCIWTFSLMTSESKCNDSSL